MNRQVLGYLLVGATALVARASDPLHRVEITDFDAPVLRDASRTDTTLYEENFSSGLGGWTAQDLTNMASSWHPDSWNSVDGTNAWWSADGNVGGYVDHTLLFLELPPLDLSNSNAPMLNFDLFYAMENPAGAPAPYDGWDACHVEVRMGAGSWQLLSPVSPAYNVSNAFAFGEIFDHPISAGWAGQSGSWLDAQFDLADYRSTATRVRIAVCSDDGTSYPDDPSLTGMQLDNIEIADGAQVLLLNDADGVDIPGPTLHYSGVPSAGSNWTSSTDHHSGPSSVQCVVLDQDVPINNGLISPPILLPHNYNLFIDFWVRLDLQDFDGDGDTSLEDYFMLEYSLDGSGWDELFYDYYDTETGSGNWYHFVDGGGHDRSTDISFLAGQLVFFRIRVKTDDNHDGGTGEGLFIDDFRVIGEPQLSLDAGLVEFRMPYPRTVGRAIDCSISVQNFGSLNYNNVPWAIWLDNQPTGIDGEMNLEIGELETAGFSLTPLQASMHFPEARLDVDDQYESNNTLDLPSYVVRPEGVLELANDYSWDVTVTEFLHTTGLGESVGVGYTQRFTIPELTASHGYALDSLRLRFASYNVPPETAIDWSLEVRLGHPVTGELLVDSQHPYAPTYAGGEASEDWLSVALPEGLELLTEGEFWVTIYTMEEGSYQSPGDPVPNPTLVTRSWEEEASARIVDGAVIMLNHHQFNYHVFGHEELIDALDEQPTLARSARLAGAWPNPFNPSTQVSFQLEQPGHVELSLFNLRGQMLASYGNQRYGNGMHQISIDGAGLASGIYLLELRLNEQAVDRLKLMLIK